MKRSISFLLSSFLATAPALADNNPQPAPRADIDDDDAPPPPADEPDVPIGPAPQRPDVRDPAPHGSDVRDPARRGPDVRDPRGGRFGASKPRLGVAVNALDAAQRTQLGVPAGRGTIVEQVQPGSVAERAGLRVGDVIIDVDGDVTRDGEDILRALADRRSGDVVAITIIRGGKSMALRATLDGNPGRADIRRGGPNRGRFGMGRPDPFDRSFDASETARLRRELDEARRRIDELERRLEKLERPRT